MSLNNDTNSELLAYVSVTDFRLSLQIQTFLPFFLIFFLFMKMFLTTIGMKKNDIVELCCHIHVVSFSAFCLCSVNYIVE